MNKINKDLLWIDKITNNMSKMHHKVNMMEKNKTGNEVKKTSEIINEMKKVKKQE